MNFALIGGGVVGQCYAHALLQQGHRLQGVWDIQPPAQIEGIAADAAVQIHGGAGAWLAGADLVVSAVFGMAALDVARRALPFMRAGSLYVDMTTATPEDMRACEAEAQPRGVDFVDVAITGAVNLRGARTPLLCAGSQSGRVADVFAGLGAPVKVVGARPGDATQLKLLRSIFAKGLEALTIECLTTAEVAGLRAELHEVLLDIDQTPLQALMEALVTTHIEHAARRRHEVVEAAALMRASGLQSLVLGGVQALFERTSAALMEQASPTASVDAALQWLVAVARPKEASLNNPPAAAACGRSVNHKQETT